MRPSHAYPLGAAPAQAGEAEEHAAASATANGEEMATAMRRPVLPSVQGLKGRERRGRREHREGLEGRDFLSKITLTSSFVLTNPWRARGDRRGREVEKTERANSADCAPSAEGGEDAAASAEDAASAESPLVLTTPWRARGDRRGREVERTERANSADCAPSAEGGEDAAASAEDAASAECFQKEITLTSSFVLTNPWRAVEDRGGLEVGKTERAYSADCAPSAEGGEDAAASAEDAASAERRTPGPRLSQARLRTGVRADIGDYEMGDDGASTPTSSSAEAPGLERTRSPAAAGAKMDPPRKNAASAELDYGEHSNRDVVAKISTLLTSSRVYGITETVGQAGTKSGGFSVCEGQADLCREALSDAFSYDPVVAWCREALADAFHYDRGALGQPWTFGTVRVTILLYRPITFDQQGVAREAYPRCAGLVGGQRRLSKVKHLDDILMRVQKHATSGWITIGEIHTPMDFAYVFTREVAGPFAYEAFGKPGFPFLEGRAELGFYT
jgi:hypothetical protein